MRKRIVKYRKQNERVQLDERMQENRIDRGLLVFAAILLALTIVYMFTTWNLNFHSDAASTNMLAREQMRTGQFFPSTWHSSTWIFLFFYNILIIPLSIFTSNQLLLQNLAVLIFLVAFVIALWFFSRKQVGSGFYLVTLCFLCSGTSNHLIDIIFSQATYLPTALNDILLVSLFTCALSSQLRIKNYRAFVGLLGLVIYVMLNGTLGLAYHILPLAGGAILYLMIEQWKSPATELKGWLKNVVPIFLGIGIAAAVGMAGYKVIARLARFSSGTNIVYPDNDSLADGFVRFIMGAIGYQPGVRLFSLKGIMNAVVLVTFIAMVICCVCLYRKYREQPFVIRYLMCFSAVLFAIYLYFDFICYCTLIGYERYFIVPLFFLYLLAGYYCYTYLLKDGGMAAISFCCAAAIFCFPCMLANIPAVLDYPAQRAQQMETVRFLEGKGLKHGYATFWNAGKNMVLSDFAVEIGGINIGKTLSPYLWVSSDMTYDPGLYEGDSFLLLTHEECNSFDLSWGAQLLGSPKEVIEFGGYVIYVYPYNIAKNNFYGQGYQDTEIISAMCVSDQTMWEDQRTICLKQNQIVYGPYMPLQKGRYQLDFIFSELEGDHVSVRLTSNCGEQVLLADPAVDLTGQLVYETSEDLENFEIVFETSGTVVIESIKITQIE